jgi:hypothetical protein
MATVAEQGEHWITYNEAMKRLAIGRPCLLSLIARGMISTRAIPGSRPTVLAADVERIDEQSTRYATLGRSEAAPCV